MTISRTTIGPSLARPIGKVKTKPLKSRTFNLAPGMMAKGGKVGGPRKLHSKRKSPYA